MRWVIYLWLIVNAALPAHAGKLAIVIDDIGYHLREDKQILALPVAISVAILPNSPHSKLIAELAQQQDREILIHLPMAPLSKQPLEADTLTPAMSEARIQKIIQQAIAKVPYAKGLNNHMGSAMTASQQGMQKVMRALSNYPLYFLDSVTIGSSQTANAVMGTRVEWLKRDVFLDHSQDEIEIDHQLNRAIQVAKKQGFAIAIGHPYPSTIRVLQQRLAQLPADIILVKPSQLLGVEPLNSTTPPLPAKQECEQSKTGDCLLPDPLPATASQAMANHEIATHEIASTVADAIQQNPTLRLLGRALFYYLWLFSDRTPEPETQS